MKTKFYTLFICFSSLFIANQLFAQKDFVVTLTGDTLIGKLKGTLFGGLKFKEEGKTESVDLLASSFKEYFNSKDSTINVSVSLPMDTQPKFLERLENGKIKLYKELFTYQKKTGAIFVRPGDGMIRNVKPGPKNMTTWYASKDGGELVEIKTDGWLNGSRSEREKNFDTLISSYPELLEDFKKEKNFSFEMLRAYIKKYNYYYKYVVKN